MKTDICAVVVSHCHGEMILTTGLLRDLVEQGVSVVCADNTGNDERLRDECERLGVTLIRNEYPRGLAANVNRCVELIKESTVGRKLVLLINPDVIITKNFVGTIYAATSHCEPLICGFEIDDPQHETVIRALPSVTLIIKIFLERICGLPLRTRNVELFGEKYTVNGSVLLCDLSLFRSLKGFDERFFLYCEDIDFVERACALIGSYGPQIVWNSGVRHIGGYGSRKIFSKFFWLHVKSLSQYFLKKFLNRSLLLSKM